MNFSAMELSVSIHDLKQQLRPIRSVDRSGMGTNDDSPAFKFENELDDEYDEYQVKTVIIIPKNVV